MIKVFPARSLKARKIAKLMTSESGSVDGCFDDRRFERMMTAVSMGI